MYRLRPAGAGLDTSGQNRTCSVLMAAACAILAGIGHTGRAADVPDPRFYVTDGSLDAVLEVGGTLYIGGNFNVVGPNTGRGNPIDLASATADTTWPLVDDGAVYAVVSDGAEGWFIGGTFTQVGGLTRTGLAHILSDKSVDPAWNPGTNGTVWALAISPDFSTLYVGGQFQNIAGVTRNRIAALSTTTGAATPWNPNSNWHVYALLLNAGGTTLYVGGYFDTIGGQARSRIAALDTTTGNATAWDPNVVAGTNYVRALALSGDESTIYIGGNFPMVGGQTRQRIAGIDTTTGIPTAFDANTAPAGAIVYAIAMSGTTVFVGGSFTGIGGQVRNNLAELDEASGNATPWDPNADGTVYALAKSGATIYAGGSFFNVGGALRYSIASLDDTSGLANAWDPTADNNVRALAIAGSDVYVGGVFKTIGGEVRNKLAALNTTTGQLTSWNPDADDYVEVLELSDGGTTVYVGGRFANIGGQARFNLAEIDLATGNATAWDPNPSGGGANSLIHAIAVSGTTVYVGGEFDTMDVTARNFIAAVDATTGVVTAWDPNVDNFVWDLHLSASTVYVAGSFANIGGAACNRIAEIDLGTGNATTWNPNADGNILSLATDAGGTVYAGGNFTNVGGQPRNRIAALDPVTGLATTWDPNVDNSVDIMEVVGSLMYVGGDFQNIGGNSRDRIALLDLTTGQACASWNAIADGTVTCFCNDGTYLYAGGGFSTIGPAAQPALAVFSLTVGPTAYSAAVIANEDTPLSGSLAAAGALSFTLVTNGTLGTAVITDAATGAYTYTPSADANGTDSFTFTADDGCGVSNVATVTVTINAVNDPPLAIDGALNVTEDTPTNGTLSAADVDDTLLTYSIISNGARGAATITNAATGAYSYTPNADEVGIDSFTFQAGDGAATSNTATVTVTISAVNDPPLAQDGALNATIDTPAAGTLIATDAEADPLTFRIVTDGSLGNAVIPNSATSSYTYTPNPGARGTDSFTFVANDGTSNSNVATITVTIMGGPFSHALFTAAFPPRGGTIHRLPDSSRYIDGATVSLTAEPAVAFRFDEWTGDAAGSSPTINLVMHADKSVAAVFIDLLPLDALDIVAIVETMISVANPTVAPVQVGIRRRDRAAALSTDLLPGSFVALVELVYHAPELPLENELRLRLFRWDDIESQWLRSGTTDVGVSVPTHRLGDYGIDPNADRVWAVVDRFGEFAVHVADGVMPLPPLSPPPLPSEPLADEPPPSEPIIANPCGFLSPLTLSLTAATLWLMRRRRF